MRGTAIAIGQRGCAHGLQNAFSVEQPADGFNDMFRIASNQNGIAAGDAFRALSAVTEDGKGNAKRWRLFLHSAGIAEDQVASEHQLQHLEMTARRA